jgi:hypothetical protein
MLWTVRDTASSSTFTLELDEPPRHRRSLTQFGMVYEVLAVLPDEHVIEVALVTGHRQRTATQGLTHLHTA